MREDALNTQITGEKNSHRYTGELYANKWTDNSLIVINGTRDQVRCLRGGRRDGRQAGREAWKERASQVRSD